MDESWRVRMGMPRRRSTEQTPSYLKHHPFFEKQSPTLNPNDDDFSDVFGGPPRTLHLSRPNNNFFQDDMFKAAAAHSMFATRTSSSSSSSSSKKTGHTFRFDDDDGVRFRTRSQSRSTKSRSSSSSPDDDASYPFSGFNSNLRPVNVPGRWSPKQKVQHFPLDGNAYVKKQCKKRNCDANARMMMMMMMSSNNFSFSGRVLSPERGAGEPDSQAILKQIVEDYELSSPPLSSAKSSVCQEEEVVKSRQKDCLMPDDIVEDEDDDDIMNSYVIEINDFNCSDPREETAEAVGVDEAIAWAKEKYQSGIHLKNDRSTNHPGPEVSASSQTRMDEDLASSSLGSNSILSTTENGTIETQKDEEQRAMELLNEGIKLWSAYKETNIQLLLSTLHHILWSSSGWTVVSLADIIESSQVKKAYQKARLCLHPDKLQQRGATPPQKYVAAEAFSILQAAWDAFISRNGV